MRAGQQIGAEAGAVVLDLDVAHRDCRHVEPQRLPVIAIVERHEHAALSAREQEPATMRLLLHRLHVNALRQSPCDLGPCFTGVERAIDVRLVVGELVPLDRRVGFVHIEVRSFNHHHFAPRSERGRCHVLPGLAIILRQLNEAVISADPDRRRAQR